MEGRKLMLFCRDEGKRGERDKEGKKGGNKRIKREMEGNRGACESGGRVRGREERGR